MGGAAALLITYLRQFRQVRVRPRTPTWLALALGAWVVAVTTFLPGLLDGTIDFAYTLGTSWPRRHFSCGLSGLRRNA